MFKLSKTIEQHSNDVKAVTYTPDGEHLVTVGRDSKAILSPPNAELLNGSAFLNSVAADATSVYIGSQDSTITAIDNDRTERLFIGHEGNVTSLATNGSGLLASGSWDYTARVWKSPTDSVVLKGHEHFVWAVAFVDSTRLLTASADKTIGVWDVGSGKRLRTISGHTDVVRGVCAISPTLFASCSNDMTVRIWSLENFECIRVLEGHQSFVYSLAYSSKDHLLISSGEDRSVRLWNPDSGECLQVITLPAVSAWSVAANPHNGDFAVGSSDHAARIFTASTDRIASDSELHKFEESVASFSLGEDQVGNVDPSQIVDASVISRPGTKEGQVVMIRPHPHGPVEVHQYSTAGKWAKIGNLVAGASTDGKKQEFEGKTYDYVFDVDIRDDSEPLKLPFNNSDNVYDVADSFIERYTLSPTYREQVVQFLLQNSQATTSIGNRSATPSRAKEAPSGTQPASSGVLSYNKPISIGSYQAEPLIKAFRTAAVTENDKRISEIDLGSLLSSLPSSSSELLSIALQSAEAWGLVSKLPALDLLRLAIIDAPSVPDMQVYALLLGCIEPGYPKHTLLAVRGLANLVARSSAREAVSKQAGVFEQALSMILSLDPGQMSSPLALAVATFLLNLVVDDYPGNRAADVALLLAPGLIDAQTDTAKEARYRLALAVGVRVTRLPSEATSFSLMKEWFMSIKGEQRIVELAGLVSPLLP